MSPVRVDPAIGETTGFRAVGVVPNLKGGRSVASVLLLKGEELRTVQRPLAQKQGAGKTRQWHDLKVRIAESKTEGYLDGKLYLELRSQ